VCVDNSRHYLMSTISETIHDTMDYYAVYRMVSFTTSWTDIQGHDIVQCQITRKWNTRTNKNMKPSLRYRSADGGNQPIYIPHDDRFLDLVRQARRQFVAIWQSSMCFTLAWSRLMPPPAPFPDRNPPTIDREPAYGCFELCVPVTGKCSATRNIAGSLCDSLASC